MIKTSDAYLVAINADSEQTLFLSEFGFVPPGAREGLALSSSGFGQLWGNRLYQLNNRSLGMGAKWNTLEHNRSVLGDGGQYIDPMDTRQTGDWTREQSDNNGVFHGDNYVEQMLDKEYDLIGIQLIFDDLGAEWATAVKVSYFDDNHALLAEKIFTNDSFNMSITFPFDGVRWIKASLISWNMPKRFAKISQMIPGQIRYITDDNLYSFLLKEEISPFGALTIPEYTITFPNENQEYNIVNPEGLAAKLRERMEIPSSIGIITMAGIEYVSTGNYPLFSWPYNANDETAFFVCRPDLALANKDYIATAFTTQTVAAAAASISTQANLSKAIMVDAQLQNILVNTNIGDNVPLQNALAQLAIAVGGYVKFERDGTPHIKSLNYGTPSRIIDYNSGWTKPDITQDTMLAGVRVRYLTYSGGRMNNAEELILFGTGIGRIEEISSGFIATIAEARRIGAIAVEYFAKRLTYSLSYRGDMSIESGDIVSVQTDYGLRNILVIEHEISYDTVDYLQGRISGIGIDN